MQRRDFLRSPRWGRKKLVVLERQGGLEDVQNAYYWNPPDYPVLFLPRLIVKASAEYFLGEGLNDLNYFSRTIALEKAKEAYRDHLVGVLKWFKRLFGLSAILQFNIIYYAERELAMACKQVEVRFVCLQKEAMWSNRERDFVGQFFMSLGGPFYGDAIAFYSSTFRDIFESAGMVPTCPSYVVGCARLDESHRLRCEKKMPGQGSVVFYLITEYAGLRKVQHFSYQESNWSRMAREVNRAIFELALEYPAINFIVKARSGSADEQLNLFFSSSETTEIPPNLVVQAGGSGHKLLECASVVVGFNTTAVLEAVAAGIPTVVPHIFSRKEEKYAEGAHLVSEGVVIADSVSLLKESILSAFKSQSVATELGPGQKIVLERYLGNSDGGSGHRLRDFLNHAVAGTFPSHAL